MSHAASPRPDRLPLKVISTGTHAIGADTSFQPHPMKGPGSAHHTQKTWANEAAPNNSLEAFTALIASSPTPYSHHDCPRLKHRSTMPIIGAAESHHKISPSPKSNINVENSHDCFLSADHRKEGTCLLAQNLCHPSRHLIRDAGTKSHVCSSASWKDFQGKVLNLPPEICRSIMDALFKDTFGPREVYPQTDAPITTMFLSLDKQLYRRYSHTYWSENTWVVANGVANDSMRFMTTPPYNILTTEFSRQVPNDAALKIRRLELRFTKDDLPLPRWRQLTRLSTSADGAEPQSIHSFDMFDDYKSECKILAGELKQLWQDKFDRVAFLELDHFALDVTQAYASDGEFLGVDVVQRLLPFVYGMPVNFKILAPTKVLELAVRKAFDAINYVA